MKARQVAAVMWLVVPAGAHGHQAGISYGELEARGGRVEVSLRVSASELAAALPLEGGDATLGGVHGDDVEPALVRAILGTVSLARGGSRCVLEGGAGRLEPTDGLRLSGDFRCDGRRDRLEVRMGFIEGMPRGHTHLAKVVAGGRVEQHVLRAGRDHFEVETPAPWWDQAARFLRLGVEHIFTGTDHIAFLLGLLLLGGTLKDVARVVTSFTAAHSITLALATLQVVRPPAKLVEPLIAASIVWVAVENLLALRHPAPHREPRRWHLGFAFGLVHGFGFAGALRELNLPTSGLAAALASFNLGVELGQAAIVALAFPLLAQLRRRPGFVPAGLRAGSIAIGAAGLVWLAERVPLAVVW